MPYAFNDRGVAEELKRFANERLGTTNHPRTASGNEVILVKAPAAGIVGIDGTTITAGTCTKVYIDMSGADPATAEDDSVEMSVLNTTSNDIAGNSLFQAARLGSLWVSVAGGGGGGTGRTVHQLQATTGVSAASGLTTGSGTAEVLELQMPSGVYQGFGTFETVRNPWEETIATGSMLTCHLENGVYVIIQASCPSE